MLSIKLIMMYTKFSSGCFTVKTACLRLTDGSLAINKVESFRPTTQSSPTNIKWSQCSKIRNIKPYKTKT